jgi:Tol biopolymer transport system component
LAIGPDLWVYDLARRTPTRITFSGTARFVPTWTPDGLALTHADGVNESNNLVVTAVNGSGSDTLSVGGRRFPTSWSPDGEVLAYTSGPQHTPTNSRDLGMLTLGPDGWTAAAFLETPFNERGALFSPAGGWVAFVSDKSGQDEIYVRSASGTGGEVKVSANGGKEPAWSPSGTELLYRTPDALMVASVETRGDDLRVGAATRLLADPYRREGSTVQGGYANYAVAANGDIVVVQDISAASTGQSTRLYLILNWTEELRALTPN